jgi:uncharacterized protein YyaL (SSP411 family)
VLAAEVVVTPTVAPPLITAAGRFAEVAEVAEVVRTQTSRAVDTAVAATGARARAALVRIRFICRSEAAAARAAAPRLRSAATAASQAAAAVVAAVLRVGTVVAADTAASS